MDLTMAVGTRAQASWWAEVTPEQRRTLLAAWAGWVLDAFDFTILLLVLGNIAGTFGVSLVAMGAVITGTLFCRLIGGVLVGTWADSGRSRRHSRRCSTGAACPSGSRSGSPSRWRWSRSPSWSPPDRSPGGASSRQRPERETTLPRPRR